MLSNFMRKFIVLTAVLNELLSYLAWSRHNLTMSHMTMTPLVHRYKNEAMLLLFEKCLLLNWKPAIYMHIFWTLSSALKWSKENNSRSIRIGSNFIDSGLDWLLATNFIIAEYQFLYHHLWCTFTIAVGISNDGHHRHVVHNVK